MNTPFSSDQPLLQIDQVTAKYGPVTAVDDVSFDIAEGEFFALLGPSGCGKTTLLRSIAGFETPASGEIKLDGSSILGIPPHKRPVNLMFQSYALFNHMSVEKNIAYGLEAEGLQKQDIQRRVGEIIEIIGLEDFAKRRPGQLSGGQRQRVALARALVKRPRLLLLDEPLSALDRKVRGEMQLELKRLQHEAGMTFVVVTHDQEEAMSMADRVAVLNRGRLEQMDTPVSLYEKPASRFVAAFIGTANLIDGTATAEGLDVPNLGFVPVQHDMDTGLEATLVVRPEDVTSTLIDSAEPTTERPGSPVFEGTVVDAIFLGGSSTVSIEIPGLDEPIQSTVHRTLSQRRGDRVRVAFDPRHIRIVPNSATVTMPDMPAVTASV